MSAQFGTSLLWHHWGFDLEKEGFASWGVQKGETQGGDSSPVCPAQLTGSVRISRLLLQWGPFLQTLVRSILSSHRHNVKIILSACVLCTLEHFSAFWPQLYPSLPSCWRAWLTQVQLGNFPLLIKMIFLWSFILLGNQQV